MPRYLTGSLKLKCESLMKNRNFIGCIIRSLSGGRTPLVYRIQNRAQAMAKQVIQYQQQAKSRDDSTSLQVTNRLTPIHSLKQNTMDLRTVASDLFLFICLLYPE